MKKFKAAIFDMDGTLLESMHIWKNLSFEYLKMRGITYPEELQKTTPILGIIHAAEFIIDNFLPELSQEEVHQGLLTVLADFYREKACFKPGAIDFLKKLQERKIKTMIFSATPQELLYLVMDRLDAGKYFSHGLLSCDTIKSSKHHPEAFVTAAQHLGVLPEEVMIFEDALYAASSAKKAGFTLGIIADSEEHRTEQMRSLADFYIEKSWDEFPVERFF